MMFSITRTSPSAEPADRPRVLRATASGPTRRSSRYNEVGGISWREGEHQVTLIVISRLRNLARRLMRARATNYGAARRLLRDKDRRRTRFTSTRHRPATSAGHDESGTQRLIDKATYGCTSDLEGLPEDQPGEHPDQGVPGDRVERDDLVQPAPRRVSDAHPAEALVPALQPRGAELRDREGLRVREGPLRRACRRRTSTRSGPSRRASSTSCSSPTTPRSIRCTSTAPTTWRPMADGGRRVRGDARRHDGQGRHRQAGALRPRVSGRRAAAAARHRHAYAASRRRNPQHRRGRGAELGRREGEARRDQARAGR